MSSSRTKRDTKAAQARDQSSGRFSAGSGERQESPAVENAGATATDRNETAAIEDQTHAVRAGLNKEEETRRSLLDGFETPAVRPKSKLSRDRTIPQIVDQWGETTEGNQQKGQEVDLVDLVALDRPACSPEVRQRLSEILETKALREKGEKAQEKAAEEVAAKATAEELRDQELEEMRGRLNRAFEAQLESERTIEMLRNKVRDEADSSEESSDCEHNHQCG